MESQDERILLAFEKLAAAAERIAVAYERAFPPNTLTWTVPYPPPYQPYPYQPYVPPTPLPNTTYITSAPPFSLTDPTRFINGSGDPGGDPGR